ncbi:radical SAM protein [Treponema phagedenis]|uniref:radical SAM protein n=1 Tax=Treponema phagedenis TaxID=162 RepID=UPI0011E672C1|nr:radical SAM protein [Treponema phagedenis]QEK02022.1 radical SAM protein [Treponema phagedenis]
MSDFFSAYDSCAVCPRRCGVNRNAGQRGFCGETSELRIAWAGLHFGEEPPVTGTGGSGTVFISGCNLGCPFCQNFQISQQGMGRAVSAEAFADICFALQNAGAENINIVTGSHAVPGIAAGLLRAKERGLGIPVVWNSSGYESTDALDMLDGLVDGWLPDLKTLNTDIARAVFKAADYPSTAKKAIKKMVRISPLVLDGSNQKRYPAGKLMSGVIVRHLALPGRIADTALVLSWFAKTMKDSALLSLMTQYTPVEANPRTKDMQAFENRLLTSSEDSALRNLLSELEIDNGFYQELIEDPDWLPDFTRIQTFSSKLSKPIWHWREGWVSKEV